MFPVAGSPGWEDRRTSIPLRLRGWLHWLTYIWLSQALLGVLPFRQDADVAALVRTGNVGRGPSVAREPRRRGRYFSSG